MASPAAAGWGQQPGLGSFGAAPGAPQAQAPWPGQQPQQQQASGTPPPAAANPWGQPPGLQPGGQMPQAQQPPQQQSGGGGMVMNFGPFKVPIGGKGGVGVSKFKIIGGVIAAIVFAVAGIIIKGKLGTTAKGNISYSALGLDRGKGDPDKMITAVGKYARGWKNDAVWWSVNLQWVKADGTVDLNKGGAEVEYASPHAAASMAKSVRNDSIKKFSFGPAGVDPGKRMIWGFTDAVEDLPTWPEPKCKIKDVIKILNGQGLTGSKTVRVTFDPQFSEGNLAWHVMGDDPKINAQYSWDDCSLVKE